MTFWPLLDPARDSGIVESGSPRHSPWGQRTVIAVIGLVLVAYLALILITGLILIGAKGRDYSASEGIVAGVLDTILFDALIVSLAYRFGLRRHHLRFSAFGFRHFGSRELGMALGGVFSAWSVLIVYGVVVHLAKLDELLPHSTLPDDVFNEPFTIVIAGIATVIVAPLAEEIFFRGFVFAGLVPRWGFWPAALVSGTIFSLAHLDPGSLLPFALVGVLLASVYYRTNTLWTSITMHFAFNVVSYSVAVATTR